MIGPTTNSGADAASGHFRDFFEGLEERELHYACAVKCNFAEAVEDAREFMDSHRNAFRELAK